jgi:hypothetical protein
MDDLEGVRSGQFSFPTEDFDILVPILQPLPR